MAEPRANTRREANPLGTIRRVIWYALRTVLIASAILALCYGVFTEAMYISNIYIVTTEGMSMRAEAVLRSASVSDLRQFFTEEQISRDVLLYRGDYHDFTVESYDYRYEIKGFRVYPWKTVGTVTYIERIPVINATPNTESDSGAVAPAWTSVRYEIQLTKIEGRWLISALNIEELDPAEEVLPTPDYSQLEQ